MALTDASCKNAKCAPDKLRARFAGAGSLYLEVTPQGAKLWRWKYRYVGKEKRLALGSYPAVSLAKARSDRDTARLLLKRGTDPAQERKDNRLADQIRMGTTFEAVARSWFANWQTARSPRHAGYVLRRLEADVFPMIGAKPIADVTAPMLLAMAKKIESRGALDIARRSWQTAGQVFEYALAHGLAERCCARPSARSQSGPTCTRRANTPRPPAGSCSPTGTHTRRECGRLTCCPRRRRCATP